MHLISPCSMPRMLLCDRYAMSGTDIVYDPTKRRRIRSLLGGCELSLKQAEELERSEMEKGKGGWNHDHFKIPSLDLVLVGTRG
eukprot:747670-Rhodomonas_salina.1